MPVGYLRIVAGQRLMDKESGVPYDIYFHLVFDSHYPLSHGPQNSISYSIQVPSF